jgi:transposase
MPERISSHGSVSSTAAIHRKPGFGFCSTTTRHTFPKETQGWLALHPQRFEFVFTPKHRSWLKIVETMFSKMARSMLRGIRVTSKQEPVDRIHLYFEQINADPVLFRWKYKMHETIG